jgi:hypothetical protein
MGTRGPALPGYRAAPPRTRRCWAWRCSPPTPVARPPGAAWRCARSSTKGAAAAIGVATLGLGWLYCVAGAWGGARRTLYDEWPRTVVLAGPDRAAGSVAERSFDGRKYFDGGDIRFR